MDEQDPWLQHAGADEMASPCRRTAVQENDLDDLNDHDDNDGYESLEEKEEPKFNGKERETSDRDDACPSVTLNRSSSEEEMIEHDTHGEAQDGEVNDEGDESFVPEELTKINPFWIKRNASFVRALNSDRIAIDPRVAYVISQSTKSTTSSSQDVHRISPDSPENIWARVAEDNNRTSSVTLDASSNHRDSLHDSRSMSEQFPERLFLPIDVPPYNNGTSRTKILTLSPKCTEVLVRLVNYSRTMVADWTMAKRILAAVDASLDAMAEKAKCCIFDFGLLRAISQLGVQMKDGEVLVDDTFASGRVVSMEVERGDYPSTSALFSGCSAVASWLALAQNDCSTKTHYAIVLGTNYSQLSIYLSAISQYLRDVGPGPDSRRELEAQGQHTLTWFIRKMSEVEFDDGDDDWLSHTSTNSGDCRSISEFVASPTQNEEAEPTREKTSNQSHGRSTTLSKPLPRQIALFSAGDNKFTMACGVAPRYLPLPQIRQIRDFAALLSLRDAQLNSYVGGKADMIHEHSYEALGGLAVHPSRIPVHINAIEICKAKDNMKNPLLCQGYRPYFLLCDTMGHVIYSSMVYGVHTFRLSEGPHSIPVNKLIKMKNSGDIFLKMYHVPVGAKGELVLLTRIHSVRLAAIAVNAKLHSGSTTNESVMHEMRLNMGNRDFDFVGKAYFPADDFSLKIQFNIPWDILDSSSDGVASDDIIVDPFHAKYPHPEEDTAILLQVTEQRTSTDGEADEGQSVRVQGKHSMNSAGDWESLDLMESLINEGNGTSSSGASRLGRGTSSIGKGENMLTSKNGDDVSRESVLMLCEMFSNFKRDLIAKVLYYTIQAQSLLAQGHEVDPVMATADQIMQLQEDWMASSLAKRHRDPTLVHALKNITISFEERGVKSSIVVETRNYGRGILKAIEYRKHLEPEDDISNHAILPMFIIKFPWGVSTLPRASLQELPAVVLHHLKEVDAADQDFENFVLGRLRELEDALGSVVRRQRDRESNRPALAGRGKRSSVNVDGSTRPGCTLPPTADALRRDEQVRRDAEIARRIHTEQKKQIQRSDNSYSFFDRAVEMVIGKLDSMVGVTTDDSPETAPPASQEMIDHLPKFTHKNNKGAKIASRDEESTEEATCLICIMEFEEGEELRALPCLHTYHCECIDDWLKQHRSCPICMQRIDR